MRQTLERLYLVNEYYPRKFLQKINERLDYIEIQSLVDQSQQDPNQLNARSLMELANHIMQRAVEGRR